MHRPTKKDILSRLLRLTPLILVVAGSVLTLIGNTASLKSCKIAGPVVITVGGLLLLFIIIGSSGKGHHTDENTTCEEAKRYANRTVLGEGSADQLGPIHHFDIKTLSKSSGNEMVPPSYEEAVKNNDKESSQWSEVVLYVCDGKELKTDATDAASPPYDESHGNTNILKFL